MTSSGRATINESHTVSLSAYLYRYSEALASDSIFSIWCPLFRWMLRLSWLLTDIRPFGKSVQIDYFVPHNHWLTLLEWNTSPSFRVVLIDNWVYFYHPCVICLWPFDLLVHESVTALFHWLALTTILYISLLSLFMRVLLTGYHIRLIVSFIWPKVSTTLIYIAFFIVYTLYDKFN